MKLQRVQLEVKESCRWTGDVFCDINDKSLCLSIPSFYDLP